MHNFGPKILQLLDYSLDLLHLDFNNVECSVRTSKDNPKAHILCHIDTAGNSLASNYG